MTKPLSIEEKEKRAALRKKDDATRKKLEDALGNDEPVREETTIPVSETQDVIDQIGTLRKRATETVEPSEAELAKGAALDLAKREHASTVRAIESKEIKSVPLRAQDCNICERIGYSIVGETIIQGELDPGKVTGLLFITKDAENWNIVYRTSKGEDKAYHGPTFLTEADMEYRMLPNSVLCSAFFFMQDVAEIISSNAYKIVIVNFD